MGIENHASWAGHHDLTGGFPVRSVDQVMETFRPCLTSPRSTYNPDTDRYERPDGTEDPGCRARRRVEESSPAALWGDH